MPITLNHASAALSLLPVPANATDIDAIVTAAYRQREQDQLAAGGNKTAILASLAAAGVTIVTATYDGYGDSGQFEEFNATLSNDTTIPLDKVEGTVTTDDPSDEVRPLAEAMEAYCYDLLEVLHDGYENNEGAYGEFVFDVAAGTVKLTHSDRFIEVETTEHEL
jgi:hypothetical protein